MDMAQILKFLPPKPARILDLGAGSGWSTEILAKCGYSVVGIDICPEMIAISEKRLRQDLDMEFRVMDFESRLPAGPFDAVISYDTLHHAENEEILIKKVFEGMAAGGVFLAMEPGTGHAKAPYSIDAMKKYGTTEKDMPYAHLRDLLKKAGFREIQQYLRLSAFPVEDLSAPLGRFRQKLHFRTLLSHTLKAGHSCLIVGRK
jgi:SAM-dependent methyltransferase